jgi:hypothetical protein
MRIDSSPILALQLQLLQRQKMVEPTAAVYISTPAEWEYLRPIITNLYMGERWELPQVMKEIEKNYGFKAS